MRIDVIFQEKDYKRLQKMRLFIRMHLSRSLDFPITYGWPFIAEAEPA